MEEKLFPNRDIHLDEEDNKTYHLEFDGVFEFVLSDVGVEMVKYALCNMPVYKTFGKFWGYNHPKDEGIWNCEFPQKSDVLVQLSSTDKMALIAIADVLSDNRCWHKSESRIY